MVILTIKREAMVFRIGLAVLL